MSKGSWLIELLDRGWVDLTEPEKRAFERWLEGAKGYDLYLLLRHVRRYRRSSSVESFRAVTEILPPCAKHRNGIGKLGGESNRHGNAEGNDDGSIDGDSE